MLEEQNARGTFYIAGGLCGRAERDRDIITAPQCRELHDRGHEIGCHTFSHAVVQSLSADEFQVELERNRRFFSEAVPGLTLESFCFPYGITSFARKQDAQKAFRSCRGTNPGVNSGTIDLGLLAATPIDHKTTERSISDAVDEAVRLNGWLIMFTHDVSPKPTWIGSTPELLRDAIRTARDRGCDVVTIHDGLDLVGADRS